MFRLLARSISVKFQCTITRLPEVNEKQIHRAKLFTKINVYPQHFVDTADGILRKSDPVIIDIHHTAFMGRGWNTSSVDDFIFDST